MKYIKLVDSYFEDTHNDVDCSFYIAVAEEDFDTAVHNLECAKEFWDCDMEGEEKEFYNSCADYMLCNLEDNHIGYKVIGADKEVRW